MFLGIRLGLPAVSQQGSVFSPADISGLSTWFKSDTGVTTVATSVTDWADQSGNGNNATSIGVPNRPIRNTGGQAGFPYITFDGSTSEMQTLTGATLGSPSHSLVFVGRLTSLPGGAKGFFAYGKGTGAPGRETSVIGENTVAPGIGWWFGGQNDVITGAGTLDTVVHGFFKIFDNPTTTVDGYEAGSLIISRNTGVYNITSTAIALGTFYGGFAPGRAPCDMYEVIIYNKALSSAERLQLAAYITNKYGVAA